MRLLILLLVAPFVSFSQNTIGLPDVLNYSKQTYGAGLQNWDIQQDKNGIIYIANNEGLLTFDGKYWNNYALPQKSNVRSVAIGVDNKIYVGGQDEFGYFSPDSAHLLKFHSLTHLIPNKDRSFGDVWDIVNYQKGIYFRTINKIFKIENQRCEVFEAPYEWAYLGVCNGKLYAHDFQKGLLQFENYQWKTLATINILPTNNPVTAILSLPNNEAIITTLKGGFFKLNSFNSISQTNFNNSNLFASERVYNATKINDKWIALATNNSGIYITDHQGNIIQSFSKKEGLQNNNVLSIFLDNQQNIWLGLDNGIDLILYNSAIKQINPSTQDGSGYAASIFNNNLYIGTSNGLYQVTLQPLTDLSFSKGNFSEVTSVKGQVWAINNINNQLLLGHHEGAFTVNANTALPITNSYGFWNFIPASNNTNSNIIAAGNYKGVDFFDNQQGRFVPIGKVNNFNESSRYIAIDKNDDIWVSHPYHGIYKLIKNYNYKVESFTTKNGLPSNLNNFIFKIKNEIVVATEKGIFQINSQNLFEPHTYFQKILGNLSIRYLKEDNNGNIWFIHEKTLGVIDVNGKQPQVIYIPELNNKLLSGFECIYPVNENNIFLGSEKGFIHLNYQKYKQNTPALQVQIRKVKVTSTEETLLFGGFFNDINALQLQDENDIPTIKDGWKAMQIQYTATLFGNQSNLQYSYRLKGFDNSWSEWLNRTEKEYTNLPAGSYTFEVKVRNNLGKESDIASYRFKILPPWYQTIWARLFYLSLFFGAVYLLFKWQNKKFKQQQLKFEEEQKKLLYIHELELSKTESELVALRNAKLEAEINFKNAELASSAMHLVKKGELLSKSKIELASVMKTVDNPQAVTELKRMIKTLSDDDKIDKEWESFAKHFDKVHSDFLVALKQKHQNITPNELKLCAYLRMNLTTKEIAQLSNISVRGVEIGRYRLRKKLQIPTELSLFDYLMSIKINDMPQS